MKLLFDTSAVAAIDRGEHQLKQACKQWTTQHVLTISTITVAEIYHGAHNSPKNESVEKAHSLLMQFNWLEFEGATAQRTGKILSQLKHTGNMIGFQDTAIAATVQSQKCDYVITANHEHFKQVLPSSKLLTIEEAIQTL